MLRVLFFLLLLIGLAFGLGWLIDRPGDITLNWQGYRIETSVLVGLGILLGVAVALAAAWNIINFVFRAPSAISVGRGARRREKGYGALSRGIIAVGMGDAKLAIKAAAEAQRHLPEEPLALLLSAEAAQLAGDYHAVEAAFKEMTQRDDMRLLGLRGLHAHAHQRGDIDKAHHFASTAHGIAALPWTATAVLEKHVKEQDWEGALAALENSVHLIDKTKRDRQRAVLMTAIALDKEHTHPDEALRLARSAVKRAPDLVPALALAARLLARKGGVRKAAKVIEAAWPLAPHPDLAKIYVDLRPGESNADRLARARALAKLSPRDPESAMTVAAAAISACQYVAAREAMWPLIQGDERPTARMCLLMAEIEEAEHGESGYAREWLTRASRAPRDACWIADGVMAEQWLPASPVTGKLDAFVWKRPDERHAPKSEAEEAIFRPVSPSATPAILLDKIQTKAIPPPARMNSDGRESAAASGTPTEAAAGQASTPGPAAPPAGSDDQMAEVEPKAAGLRQPT
jgi:HemY protein